MSTKPEEEESGPQSPVPGGLRSFQGPQLGGVLQTTDFCIESVEDQENVQAKAIDKLATMFHQETNSDISSALVIGLPPESLRSRPPKVDKIRKDQPKNPEVIVYNKEYEELKQLHEEIGDKLKELEKAKSEMLVKIIEKLLRKLKEKNKHVDDLESKLIKLSDEMESMKLQQRSPDPFPNKKKIGEGSTDGTIVYKAKDKNDTNLTIDVAVKRMIADQFDEERRKRYERESGLLKLSQDKCDNVVKYYRDFYTDDFFYLVMEYCDFTLYDAENHAIETKVDWLRQAVNGVQHIHSLEIAHRDLKPHNILLRKQPDGSFKVKISDFGLSKQYRPNQTASTARPKGTRGWAAPELHDAKKKKPGDDGTTGDIFTMGCVVYFVLTGQHLFGEDEDDRQRKIQMNEVPPMEQLASVPGCAVAKDLIRKMITFDPNPDQPLYSRLSTEEVRCHCFFLSEGMQCHFFEEVNDYIKAAKDQNLSEELDKDPDVVDNNWTKHLLPRTKAEKNKDYSVQTESVCKLIEYIRNKIAHANEVVEYIEKKLGLQHSRFPKHTVVKYFTTNFPKLLLHVYTVMKERDEEVIKKYYRGNLICCTCVQE